MRAQDINAALILAPALSLAVLGLAFTLYLWR